MKIVVKGCVYETKNILSIGPIYSNGKDVYNFSIKFLNGNSRTITIDTFNDIFAEYCQSDASMDIYMEWLEWGKSKKEHYYSIAKETANDIRSEVIKKWNEDEKIINEDIYQNSLNKFI